jgi:hypothetical protein
MNPAEMKCECRLRIGMKPENSDSLPVTYHAG